MTLQYIVEFVAVLAVMIIVHEWGHFIACRVFKIPVDEFGVGLPPRLLRFWRSNGSLTVGRHKIEIPHNFDLPFDRQHGLGRPVEIVTLPSKDKLVLKAIDFAATEDGQYRPTHTEPFTTGNGEIRLDGILHEIKTGTEFTLNWIPLGGFVRPRGENDPAVNGGLAAAKPLVRIGVALAGPLMNLLLAVAAYTAMFFVIGGPDPTRANQVEIQGVLPDSPAYQAGLQYEDIILAINGQAVQTVTQAREIIYDNLDQPITMRYQRGGQISEVKLTPLSSRTTEQGATGVQLGVPLRPATIPNSIWNGFQATYQHCLLFVDLIGRMITGQIPFSNADVVGPIGMGRIYVGLRESSPVAGVIPFLDVLSFITSVTVSLGMLNLLPIPVLDGGRILLALPEIIIRRRVNPRVENWLISVTFLLLLAVLIVVSLRDVLFPIW